MGLIIPRRVFSPSLLRGVLWLPLRLRALAWLPRCLLCTVLYALSCMTRVSRVSFAFFCLGVRLLQPCNGVCGAVAAGLQALSHILVILGPWNVSLLSRPARRCIYVHLPMAFVLTLSVSASYRFPKINMAVCVSLWQELAVQRLRADELPPLQVRTVEIHV